MSGFRHLGAAVLALAVLSVGPASGPAAAGELPEGVPATADSRNECYLKGEKRDLARAIDATRVPVEGCPAPVIPPRRAVESFRVYAKGSTSRVDCAGLRANDAASAYLDRFLRDLVRAADGGAGPACGAAMVSSWAEAGAMGAISEEGSAGQAALDRAWTVAGITAAWFAHPEVRAAARTAGTEAETLAWMGRLAGQILPDIARAQARDRENNTQYWRAFAILPTALLTGDAELLGIARGVFERGLAAGEGGSAGAGFLPLELARGDKALRYQIFAAKPLAGMALMSQTYGCDFLRSDADRARFAAILARAVEGEVDPGIVEAAVGKERGKAVAQQGASGNSGGLLYLARETDPALLAAINARVRADTGSDPPEPDPTAHLDRLGGSFAALAATVADLREAPPPPGLARACRRAAA